MNAIVSFNRVNFYNDLTRSARFTFAEYNIAFNGEIHRFKDEIMGAKDARDPRNFQLIQSIRDSLYTLIATATPSITNGSVVTNDYFSYTPSHVNFPTDYNDYVLLMCTIDAKTTYARPATYGSQGPLVECSFRHPTNKKPYFNEDSTGLTVLRGVGGGFSSCTLTYIKEFTPFSMGNENNLIDPGGAVLTNGVSYIATEVSVQNSTVYQVGTQFTAVGTALTSGQVIAAANTSPIPLPEKVHEEICRRVSAVMLGTIQQYNPSQFVDSIKQ